MEDRWKEIQKVIVTADKHELELAMRYILGCFSAMGDNYQIGQEKAYEMLVEALEIDVQGGVKSE